MTNTTKSYAELIEGYHRFREGDWKAQRERWKALSDGQEPQVMVISCSDSRVDPAQILDVAPGEIFVVRNVAAMVPPYEKTPGQHGVSAAVEFAVQFLKVREIVVMGHGACGGCQAALSRSLHGEQPGAGGFVAAWVGMLDAVSEHVSSVHGTDSAEAELAMEMAAVRQSIANLRSFPFVAEKEAAGELTLHGAHFAIATGILNRLDESEDSFSPA